MDLNNHYWFGLQPIPLRLINYVFIHHFHVYGVPTYKVEMYYRVAFEKLWTDRENAQTFTFVPSILCLSNGVQSGW